MTGAPWWTLLYDDVLADVLLERDDPRETEASISFLITQLGLRPGARVFDQCCGTGSLAVPLAQAGLDVTGCDLIPSYVERARIRARAAGVAIEVHVGDAFETSPARPCDGAFNWWTGFGYADDDSMNVKMLRAAWVGLKPGGRYLLDFMNVPSVLRSFRDEETTRRHTDVGDVVLLRVSRIDAQRGTLHKRWVFTFPDGRVVERDSVVKLYMPWQLAALLAEAGFEDVVLLGGLDAQPLTVDSPRCIAVARRPP